MHAPARGPEIAIESIVWERVQIHVVARPADGVQVDPARFKLRPIGVSAGGFGDAPAMDRRRTGRKRRSAGPPRAT